MIGKSVGKHPLRVQDEVSIQVKTEVEVFWVVTPCIVVVGYQRFGAP
jgi:hypothetical protein